MDVELIGYRRVIDSSTDGVDLIHRRCGQDTCARTLEILISPYIVPEDGNYSQPGENCKGVVDGLWRNGEIRGHAKERDCEDRPT